MNKAVNDLEKLLGKELGNFEDYARLKRLIEGVFNNVSLDTLMDTIELALDAPAMIVDMGFQVVALSHFLRKDPFYKYYNSSGFLEQSFVKQICSHYVFTKINEREYSSAVINLNSDERLLVASIRISGVEVLILIIAWDDRPVGQEELQRIKKICQVMAVEFQKENSIYRYRLTVPNHAISSLLSGGEVDREDFLKQASNLDWLKAGEYRLMIIADRSAQELWMRASSVISALKLFLPLECCLTHDSDIVVYLTRPVFESVCVSGQDKFKRFLDNNALRSAVGRLFTDIMDSRYHYQLAKKTLETANKFKLTFAMFDDIKHYIVADLIDSKFNIKDFLHPGILKLLTYDSENNTELISTLRAYIYGKNNIDTVTKQLNIHRSTLFYKLKKIKELTNINFETIKDISMLYFSLKLIEIFDENTILSPKYT